MVADLRSRRAGRHRSGTGPRLTRRLGSGASLTVSVVALLLIGTMANAELPPEPSNPSDSDISNAQDASTAAAAEVGRVDGLMTRTQGDITRLRGDLELKGELVKKAMIDAQLAQQDVVAAQAAAAAAAVNAQQAGGQVDDAEDAAAAFAAASFRQGSVLGSVSAYLDAANANDLLSREQLIKQVADNQLNVIGGLQVARSHQATLVAAAKATADETVAAQQRASAAQVAAQTAQKSAADAFKDGQAQLADLQTQLTQQQAEYDAALDHAADLKGQRAQYVEWVQEKLAEEARLKAEAEERAREAAAAAAAQAAAQKAAAEQAAAEQQAAAQAAAKATAEKAAAAQAAADQEAAAQAAEAAAQKVAAAKLSAAKVAAAKLAAAKSAAARVAAAQAAAANAAAAKAAAAAVTASKNSAASAAARAAAARAAAAKAARDNAAALEAARVAAARLKTKQVSVYYASCADAEAAHAAPIHRGQPGYRAGLDRNGNGIACETLPDSAAQYGGSPAPAPAPAPAPTPASNDNVASSRNDTGGSSAGAWSAAKGQAAVAAAEQWVGTPYSWGGGNSSGPTLGICGPDGAWNDCNIVGFDCSGLTSYAWAQEGISIPAYSVYQYTLGQHVDSGSLMPGDLMFYADDTSDPSTIHHVTMYAGNGQMVEAPYSGAYVHVTDAEFGNGFIGATRPGT